LLIFYVATCTLAILVAFGFLQYGIWLVLPFSGLEMLVLGVVLRFVFREARRREVITIDNALVQIEKGTHSINQSWQFERIWVRFQDEMSDGFRPRRVLELGSHGEYIEASEFLSNLEKDGLVLRLKDCIIRA
jgi:uncharacterized membrane protein